MPKPSKPPKHSAPASEWSTRRDRALNLLSREKVDGLIVTWLPNVRYLSGFAGSNAVLLIGKGGPVLFTDPRYTIQAQAECDVPVKVEKGILVSAAAKAMLRRGWRKVGFEQSRITFGSFSELLENLQESADLIPTSGLIETARMVKSSAEIALIHDAVITNSNAFDKALRRLKPTSTETDLAAEIEYQMRRFGAEKPAFETIVASGAHSALPHASPRPRPIESHRLLLIDMGATRAGYTSDMTRTINVGRASSEARAMYQAVLEAQLAAIDSVKAGVTAATVDGTARRVLRRHGLAGLFVHSTGHGLGLEIHETPRLGKRDTTLLEPGMTITIEPGAYRPDFGGVRIEDTVVVTSGGCDVLTPTSKEFLTL